MSLPRLQDGELCQDSFFLLFPFLLFLFFPDTRVPAKQTLASEESKYIPIVMAAASFTFLDAPGPTQHIHHISIYNLYIYIHILLSLPKTLGQELAQGFVTFVSLLLCRRFPWWDHSDHWALVWIQHIG